VSFLRQYLIAVQCFTRMPVTGALAQWVGFSPDMLRASAVHFPGVGWIVGLVACAAFAVIGLMLQEAAFAPLAAAVGSTIATVLLTGAVHEDEMVRAVEALSRDVTDNEASAATTAVHLGTYGALGLVLVVLAKISLLAVLASQSPAAVLLALFAAHVVSRFWPLVMLRTINASENANANASGGPPGAGIGNAQLGIAAAWCLVPLAVALLIQGLAFVLMSVLFSGLALWALKTLFARKLQGLTDECMGATQQACEIAFYFGAAIAWSVG
jgi:adenosylcobinamide-GDP ribazoletransferase